MASNSNLRPLGDHVIVEALAQEEQTSSGIFLPETAKEKPQQGKILAVGPGRILDDGKRAPMEVKKGDTVVFAKYAGTEVKMGDRELLVIRENDVLAVVES